MYVPVLHSSWIHPHPLISPQDLQSSDSNDPRALQREDTLVVSEHPEEEPIPMAEIMAEFNIKVRDFAYECVLPPIPPTRPSRHAQEGLRLLRRATPVFQSDEDGDDVFTDYGTLQPSAILARVDKAKTTPHDQPELFGSQPESSQRVNTPLRSRGAGNGNASPGSSKCPRTPPRRHRSPPSRSQALTRSPAFNGDIFSQRTRSPSQSQPFSQSQSQPPLIADSQSQQTDSHVATPNGSQERAVADTSDVPASQLDTTSELPVPVDVTFSQLGFHGTPDSQPESPYEDRTSLSPPRPNYRSGSPSPSSKRPPNPKNPKTPFPTPSLSTTSNGRSRHNSASHAQTPTPITTVTAPSPTSSPSNTPTPTSPPPRYFLRKRPSSPDDIPESQSATSSASSSKPTRFTRPRSQSAPKPKGKASARMNGAHDSPHPTRVTTSVSRQSAHSRTPTKAAPNESTSARPFKKQKV